MFVKSRWVEWSQSRARLTGQWLNCWLEQQSPHDIVRWAADRFGQGLVMTSSFGLNGVALIHMLHEIGCGLPIIFVDTGLLFPETLETKTRIQDTYGVTVLTFRPILGAEVPYAHYSTDPGGQYRNYESHGWQPNRCCALRKIEPMKRAVAELRPVAILNGRARFQADSRRHLPILEEGRTPLRVNPLAAWTQRRVEDYVKTHNVPYNPLHDRGYPSIGCRPCTRPVRPGEHIRTGRWTGSGKTECGLWTTNYAPAD